jgi:peptidoglycan/xylan/chitin deacetylase (PgdA/CDA1 family)
VPSRPLAVPYRSDFQPGQAAPYSYLPWFFLALLALGALYMVDLQRARPGMVAQAGAARPWPELLADGHEMAHHGFLHLRSDRIDATAQRQELVHGLAALPDIGAQVAGYRSPSWELTPETLAMLAELGLQYDSSCMGDDRPYYEEHGGSRILEFPIHWSLDDWPYLAWHPGSNELLSTPAHFTEVWFAEFESAVADRRHLTFTMHPEVIGRGYRMAALGELLTRMCERAHVWFARHADLGGVLGGEQ